MIPRIWERLSSSSMLKVLFGLSCNFNLLGWWGWSLGTAMRVQYLQSFEMTFLDTIQNPAAVPCPKPYPTEAGSRQVGLGIWPHLRPCYPLAWGWIYDWFSYGWEMNFMDSWVSGSFLMVHLVGCYRCFKWFRSCSSYLHMRTGPTSICVHIYKCIYAYILKDWDWWTRCRFPWNPGPVVSQECQPRFGRRLRQSLEIPDFIQGSLCGANLQARSKPNRKHMQWLTYNIVWV